MTLSAELLDRWDRCERRFALSREYEPRLISPFGVLYSALEAALLAPDPEQVAKDETMRLASTHDLVLTELNQFMTVRHTGYLAGILAVALRERLGELHRVPPSEEWESGLLETPTGIRHRIELVSHLDDDRLRASAHSWRVIGELAALQSPLTLTAVVIGPQRGGRRHSEWTKGLRHPVNRALRFAPRNNKKSGFSEGWEKVWREQENLSTEKWIAQMRQDGVLDQLIISREIGYNPDDNRIIAAQREMEEIAQLMSLASPASPMRRSSCDEFGGCPFATVCYSPTAATPASFPHLYWPREPDTLGATLEEYMSAHHTAVSSRRAPTGLAGQGLPAR